MKIVMKTRWEDLIMVNYEVDREWAEKFVPAGCELELYEGKAIVSVVAFRFSKTKICGLPMPLYRDFAEINLRIYVKSKVAVDGDTQRGVVFIKEVIPYRLPALLANKVFKENFYVMPVEGNCDEKTVKYEWGGIHTVSGDFAGDLAEWKAGSEEEFIADNFWAYKDHGAGKTLVFEVVHEPWKMRRLENVKVEIDIAALYGVGWDEHMRELPCSVFYVDGSEVGVTLPKVMKNEQ